MEYKIISTKNYLLIVDDSEIKEGDTVSVKWKNQVVVSEHIWPISLVNQYLKQ